MSGGGVTGKLSVQARNNDMIETAGKHETAKPSDKRSKFQEFKFPSGRMIPSLVDPATGNSRSVFPAEAWGFT